MARKNRYAGILQARQVGKGGPEVSVVVLYDIEDDGVRLKTSEICLDYGLERIQFSAFHGKLNRNRRQELSLRLARELEGESARVRIIPICEEDWKDAWVLEQYRVSVEAVQEVRPKLKVLKQEDE